MVKAKETTHREVVLANTHRPVKELCGSGCLKAMLFQARVPAWYFISFAKVHDLNDKWLKNGSLET